MKVKSLLLLIIVSGLLNAQYQNVRVDLPSTSSANEPSIAINPANPLQLAAGANISYFFSSTDRGQTWTQKNMNSSLGVWGDPCLIL
jgi:biopolymer transport protein ExbD